MQDGLCGAKTRSGGKCKNAPVTGSKRCRMHGGKTPRGIASPNFKTGKYSKDMPTRLAARYEQNLSDPLLVELRSELALTDARIGELLASTSISGAAQSWLDAGKELKALESAIYDPNRSVDQVVAGIEALKSILNRPDDRETWQELGFLTWEKYCEARLHIAAEKLETEARNRVAERVAEIDENARPLAEAPGGDKKSEQYKNHSYNHKNDFSENAGTNADYLIARIARDNPEILEGMKQGKYRSVRAAAIDAGIIDPNKTRRHQLPTDPTAAGQYLAKRVDAEWMATMLEAYQDARVS